MAMETVTFLDDSYIEYPITNYQGNCAVGNYTAGGGDVKGALRFTNIVIPKDASINFAKIYYKYSTVGSSGTWKWRLYGIDEDNTADFSSYPMGRTKTTAYNQYDEGAPTSGGAKELDVISILSEITSRSSWSSGNAVGFLCEYDSSATNVFAFIDTSDSFLAYRLSAEPDFTPATGSVSAPSTPSAEDYGIKISMPGIDVLDATDSQLYYTSRKKRFRVYVEAQATTNANPYVIAHNLGYIPFAEVFAKSGSEWFRLPWMNFSGGENIGYMEVDDTNLTVYVNTSTVIYYYIFLDQLAT